MASLINKEDVVQVEETVVLTRARVIFVQAKDKLTARRELTNQAGAVATEFLDLGDAMQTTKVSEVVAWLEDHLGSEVDLSEINMEDFVHSMIHELAKRGE